MVFTFDDGPAAPATHGGSRALMDILEAHGIKGSFFVVGRNITAHPDVLREIHERGHEIANHSDTHPEMGDLEARGGVEAIRANIYACSRKIKEITGEYPILFRSPYLSSSPGLNGVVGELGMAHICTDVSPQDWDRDNTPADIANATIARARDGGFVCFHDSNTSHRRTQEALPTIIEELRKQGYWFLTVQQLFNVRETEIVPGVRYVNLPPSP